MRTYSVWLGQKARDVSPFAVYADGGEGGRDLLKKAAVPQRHGCIHISVPIMFGTPP